LVTLVLLQAFVIVAGIHVITNDISLSALSEKTPGPTASADPPPVPVVTAKPVLAAGGNGPLPTKTTLAGRLRDALGDPALGKRVGAAVVDVGTGATLYGSDPGAGITPASTTKLVTSVAALASLGPDARLATRVVRGPARNTAILVGGGDPTLLGPTAPATPAYPKQASLAQLALLTAKALKAEGVTKITLSYDDSLFTGPRIGPGWKPVYIPDGEVAPVSALAIDQGRRTPDTRERVSNPSRSAVVAFASLLRKYGVTASRSIGRAKAVAGAQELARVESAPVYALVERTLTLSDNDMAEALARHVAIKESGQGTFAAVGPAVQGVLKRIGVTQGIRVHDGSGLSIRNRISASGLAGMLATAASPANRHLHAVLGGLPIAGFSGTLDTRFARADAAPGIGIVRAKTGTLNNVSTLAGVTTTTSGRLVAFAFMADRVPLAAWDRAESALDRLATVVART
jgi:D-alanyl-D-alanine carboxypeptidase/D-alanyl-D-alanine-endopeptidase (penicillin-binding protein 4)